MRSEMTSEFGTGQRRDVRKDRRARTHREVRLTTDALAALRMPFASDSAFCEYISVDGRTNTQCVYTVRTHTHTHTHLNNGLRLNLRPRHARRGRYNRVRDIRGGHLTIRDTG